jgi:hypothetical protein
MGIEVSPHPLDNLAVEELVRLGFAGELMPLLLARLLAPVTSVLGLYFSLVTACGAASSPTSAGDNLGDPQAISLRMRLIQPLLPPFEPVVLREYVKATYRLLGTLRARM